MTQYLRKRPMIIAAVGCIISAVCGFYWKTALIFYFCLILLGAIFSIFYKNISALIICLLVLAVTGGCFITLNRIDSLNRCNQTITANVCITDTVYTSESYCLSEAEVIKSDNLPSGTKLSLWRTSAPISSGDIITARIKPMKIDPAYKADSYSKGIYLSGSILSFKRSGSADFILSKVELLRKYIRTTLFNNMSFDSAATICALVFGDRDYFSDDFYNNVKAAGVAHVMVVSGMHLAIIVSLALRIFRRFVYSPYLKALIMILTVGLLCTLCGFAMSIMRAGVTYIIMAIGLIIKRQYSGENALAAAVVIILLFSPFAILNIGFQLSVLSTFGILAVSAPICNYLDTKAINKPLLWLSKSVILSLSALLLTLPVTIYIFGYVSVVSVITNLLIAIPVSFCLSVAVILLFLYPLFPFYCSMIFKVIDYIVGYINFVINHLGSMDFATVTVPVLYTYISVAVIFLVFWILLTCKRKRDMLKLEEINVKVLNEGGRAFKWQSSVKKL